MAVNKTFLQDYLLLRLNMASSTINRKNKLFLYNNCYVSSDKFGTIGFASILGVYIGLGIIFIGFLFKSFKYSASTR